MESRSCCRRVGGESADGDMARLWRAHAMASGVGGTGVSGLQCPASLGLGPIFHGVPPPSKPSNIALLGSDTASDSASEPAGDTEPSFLNVNVNVEGSARARCRLRLPPRRGDAAKLVSEPASLSSMARQRSVCSAPSDMGLWLAAAPPLTIELRRSGARVAVAVAEGRFTSTVRFGALRLWRLRRDSAAAVDVPPPPALRSAVLPAPPAAAAAATTAGACCLT